ncbi:hypothetical protein BDV97DRAFT_408195 [Delphinella strobiligena]|nr:hypothetical protein BDV97DRAFT_408195 [Delphinella strobiligena]
MAQEISRNNVGTNHNHHSRRWHRGCFDQIATRLIPILATLGNFTDAPKHAQDILMLVAGIKSIAEQLQAFIERRTEAPQVRQHLLIVEHMQVILVECVITYSELEPIMDSLGVTPARGFWNRIKWKYKENDISRILDRLGDHRLSLSLMLTILNGHSLLDAASRAELCNMFSQVLDNNKELLIRLRHLESISATGQQNSAITMGELPDICSISLPLLPKAISDAHRYTKDLSSVYDTESAQVSGQSFRKKQNDIPSNLEADYAALRPTSQGNDLSTSEVHATQSPNSRRTCLCDAASGGSDTRRSFGYPPYIRDPPLIHFNGLDNLENIQALVNGRSYLIPRNGVPITIELYASETLPRISRKIAQKMQNQVAVEDIKSVRLETAGHRHSAPAQITPSSKYKDRATGRLETLPNPDGQTDPRLARRSSPRQRPRAINSSTETSKVFHSRCDNPGYRVNDRIPQSCPYPPPPSLTIPIPETARLRPNRLPSLERHVDKKHKHHQLENHRPRPRGPSRMPDELTQRHDQRASDSSDTDHDYTTHRHADQRSHSHGRRQRQFETSPPPYQESTSRNRLTKQPPILTTETSSTHPRAHEPRDDASASYNRQIRPSSRGNKLPVFRIWVAEQGCRQESDTERRHSRGESRSRGRGVGGLRGLVERGTLRSRSRLVMP